ncbi:MAG: DUF2917 domain-containing protein [Caldimonas sp.]
MLFKHQSMPWVSLDISSGEADDIDLASEQVVMMNTQQSSFLASASSEALKALPTGHVVALGTGGGEVSILSGQVWLTRSGDPDDHFLGTGESFRVRGSGATLVETWSQSGPALISWRPRTLIERVRDRFTELGGRCWELMNPAGRVGIGSVAALAAIVVAGLLFGPVSEARSRALAARPTVPAVLHNANVDAARATETRGSLADGNDTRDRAQGAAQQARRGAAGPA